MSEYKLMRRIIELSEADIWEKAKLEWVWIDTFFIADGDEYETCLCGHYPIKECCVIRNKKNGRETIIGNCCINKFMDTESDLIFQCIRRLQDDIEKSLNVATIEYAYRMRVISRWEYNFYYDVRSKRNLSYKQTAVKLKINERVLNRFRKGYKKCGMFIERK